MQVLFYAGRDDKDKDRLEAALHDAIPQQPIESFTRLEDFRQRFHFIVEPDSIAVLLAADVETLLEMQMFRQLLPEIYVILVIPDWQESTVKLAHRLLPRFLSHKEDSFTDLKKVLKKMARKPH